MKYERWAVDEAQAKRKKRNDDIIDRCELEMCASLRLALSSLRTEFTIDWFAQQSSARRFSVDTNGLNCFHRPPSTSTMNPFAPIRKPLSPSSCTQQWRCSKITSICILFLSENLRWVLKPRYVALSAWLFKFINSTKHVEVTRPSNAIMDQMR